MLSNTKSSLYYDVDYANTIEKRLVEQNIIDCSFEEDISTVLINNRSNIYTAFIPFDELDEGHPI
jgi:hypothetical protein